MAEIEKGVATLLIARETVVSTAKAMAESSCRAFERPCKISSEAALEPSKRAFPASVTRYLVASQASLKGAANNCFYGGAYRSW